VLYSFIAPPQGANPTSGVIRDSAGNLYGTAVDGGAFNSGVVYKLDKTGKEKVLYSFTGGADGSQPHAGVIRDSTGNLYGTTRFGGTSQMGVVYKLDTTGKETVLYSFTGGADGRAPFAGVVRDPSGNLYGTTDSGGASDFGTVFKVDTAGRETVLYSFTGGADGGNPERAGVVRDSAGNLYGTTFNGGASLVGVVYKLETAGQETVLYSFTGETDGGNPLAGVIRDSVGNLYGTTAGGGASGWGTVYKLNTSGQEMVLYSFTGADDGGQPQAGVIMDSTGNLYGTTEFGGASQLGVVYKVDKTGKETVLHTFTGGADGSLPDYAGVIRDSAGNLYGTTNSGGTPGEGSVYRVSTTGQEKLLYVFPGSTGGNNPASSVIRDSGGNLYGTTLVGGSFAWGVVYKLDVAGHETVLYSFTNGTDGGLPRAGVIRDSAGNLYGTTNEGGTAGRGVLYKVNKNGKETVLHSFTGEADGDYPFTGVIRDPAGNLYGTTSDGGRYYGGQVYKVSANGQMTALYSFTGGADGGYPDAGVIRDSAGNFYGTTDIGGTFNNGVVYKVNAAGQETVLYSFTGGVDGSLASGVIRDSAGNLYGTTDAGGTSGAGVVYKVDMTGHETVLYSFTGGADGGQPLTPVVRDSAGNLYGTTSAGGTSGAGVVYKVDATGHETVLYSFTGGVDGSDPQGVIRDSAGNLYGTTYAGGTKNSGVVFEVKPSP
jgi:uncharacterized repeat protein (TIGR03803 family)